MLSLLDLKRVVGHVGAPSANNYVVHLSVWETETSIVNNTSTVKYKMWITAENDKNVTEYDGNTKYMSGWSVDGAQLRATINLAGKQVAQTTAYYTLYWNRSWQNSAELIAEGSTTVTHGPDGNLNMSITATLEQLNNYASNPSNGTISTSGWLDYIPRASTATLDKTTLTADGSSVKLTIAKATSSFTTTLTWKYGNSTGTLLNKSAATTATFTPNPADLYGQGLSGKVYFYLYTYNGNTQIGDTKTYSIDMTIPSVSTIKATDANIGSVSQLTITRNSTAYKHSLYYTFGTLDKWMNASGDTSTTEVKHDKTSVGFTIPSTFYAQIPNSKTGKAKVYVITYYGNSKVGATQSAEFTVTAANSSPYISDIKIEDQNSTTLALTGDATRQIRYYSNPKVSFTATARNSSTIKDTIIGGVSAGATGSPTRTLNGFQGGDIDLSVTDSRGYVSTGKASPSMVNYVKLTSNHKVYRPQPTDGSARIIFSGDYWDGNFGATSNYLRLEYRWKEVGGSYSSWVRVYATTSGGKYSLTVNLTGFDYQKSYQFQLYVHDALNTFYFEDNSTLLREGFPVFDWGKNSFNVNVPVFATREGAEESYIEARNGIGRSVLDTSAGRCGLWGGFSSSRYWIIYNDADGNTKLTKSPTIEGHTSPIGDLIYASGNAYFSDGSSKPVCSLTIPAGTWSITGGLRYPTHTTGAKGLSLAPSANWAPDNSTIVQSASSDRTTFEKNVQISLSTQTTYNLYWWSSANFGTSPVNGYISAMRLS